MRILLTGAAGQVGRRLLSELQQAGYSVRALVRQNSPDLTPADELVIENLTAQSDFSTLLANMDVLVHLADGFNAYEHLPQDLENRQAAKRLQTTKSLTKAATKAGVRIIYLSTIKTMCGTYADHILSEATPPRPQSLYGQLKLDAEQAILTAAQHYNSKAVILRFPVVFGLETGSMEQLARLLESPLPLPFKGLEKRRSLISSHCLIEAIMTIIEQPKAESGTYLVHEGSFSITDIARLIRQGLGRPERLFKLPSPLWHALEKLPLLGPRVQRFTRSLELDDQHFRQTYNWQPSPPLPATFLKWAKGLKKLI